MNLRLFTSIAVLVLLSSCGKFVPSESAGAAPLREDIANKSKGEIELVSFDKTDGHDLNVFGRIAYVMEFHAKLRTKEPLYLTRTGSYSVVDDPRSSFADRKSPPLPEQLIPTGTEFELKGTVTYEKKESGWVFSELESKRLPHAIIDAATKPPPPMSF